MIKFIKTILLSLICMLFLSYVSGQTSPNSVTLKGYWKFKIGDNTQWAATNYNDDSWSEIYAPSRWESHGYNGYDGFAWYRKSVVIPNEWGNHNLILKLGYIDDVDEVYINGVKIGKTGSFPPNFITAYNALRSYPIPSKLIVAGVSNIIAVRVFDTQMEGGIVSGDIKIESKGITAVPIIDLSGEWQISKGRNFDPDNARKILVPGQWENQGMNNYDGFATYQTTFEVSPKLAAQQLILMAGRIDDLDEVYINGQLVGSTGSFKTLYCENQFSQFRNYSVPQGIIVSGKNEILIKVYDRGAGGGIVEGPVGLITLKSFRDYWKEKRR